MYWSDEINGEKCDRKWFSVIQNGPNRTFKMATGGHFEQLIEKNVAYWSEMTRNAIEIDFRSSKMAAGGHFVNKIPKRLKLRIDLKWWEMRSKVIFGHPKWPPVVILWKHSNNKSCVLIWNGEKSDQKLFSIIQNGRRGSFCEKKYKSCVLIRNSEKYDRKSSCVLIWIVGVVQHQVSIKSV